MSEDRRKDYVERSKLSDSMFRAMFETASVGMAVVAGDRILDVNEKLCQIVAYSRNELLQMHAPDLTHPDDRAADAAKYFYAHDNALAQHLNEKRLIRKDGMIVWVRVNSSFIRDDSGSALRTLSVVEDITERKQNEAALRDSEYQLRDLLNGIPGRAWFKDTQFRFIFMNQREAEAYAIPAEKIIGRTTLEFRPRVEAERVMAEDRQVMVEGKTLRMERPSHVTGVWSEVVKSPLRRADGTIIGMVGLLRDITGHKRIETELLAAKSVAEAANRAKGEFLSHMSHEMRTPMNAILGFAELALMDQPADAQRDNLEKIEYAAKSLLRVIDDVLDFERVDAGKLTLESIDFVLLDVLSNVRDVVESVANNKALALRFQVDDNLPVRLNGDPTRIGQILMNLCANAIKFTQRGYVEVAVRHEADGDDRVTLRFDVRDTGIGITSEALARLFQPFAQADSSTTRRYGGTGLGLIICKRLVELMHGNIGMDSEPGNGTTVSFSIVCGIGKQPVRVHPLRRDDLPAEAARLRGARVLVVDDHPVNRTLIGKILQRVGAQSVPAGNGREALEALEQGVAVDLVLMDLRMPEMDGIEASRRIRADARWAHLPIIAVTASATTHERTRCLDAGMNDVLVKPIQQATFFPVIAAWMRDKK